MWLKPFGKNGVLLLIGMIVDTIFHGNYRGKDC